MYYDGINFDRFSMQRVRKVLERGVKSRGGGPLIDIHTGDNGWRAPAATRYLSHFAYADSAWNGEGFEWGRGPVYWLVAASGLLHGIFADRLGGGGYDFKALLFAMYTRNLPTAPPIWSFWRAVGIGEAGVEIFGWWLDDGPVKLTLRGSWGGRCSTTAFTPSDPEGNSTALLATSHVARGSHTVINIASWCDMDAEVSLGPIDWATLGLNASECWIEQPSINMVQEGRPSLAASQAGTHPITVKAGHGVVLVLRKARPSVHGSS